MSHEFYNETDKTNLIRNLVVKMALNHIFDSICVFYARPLLLKSFVASGGIIGHFYGLTTAINENREKTFNKNKIIEYTTYASTGTILGAGVGATLYFALPTISIISLLAIPAISVAKFNKNTIKN